MIDGMFVIDGVAHAYDFSPSNRLDGCGVDHHRSLAVHSYEIAHAKLESRDPGYLLTLHEFSSRWDPGVDLAHTFFVESDVDMMVHHSVQIGSYFPEGTPGWPTGVALKKVAPERVLLYGCVDPFEPDRGRIFAHMERMAAEGAVGFKFYPSNGFFDIKANRLVSMLYSDPELAYPFFEKARALGIKHVAFHKTMPVGQGPTTAAHVEDDVSTAAAVFSDMTFEVVHSGWAFLLRKCAIQLKLHKNVYANLECRPILLFGSLKPFCACSWHAASIRQRRTDPICEWLRHQPRRPGIERHRGIRDAERSHRVGNDYPPFTPELKRKILGETDG